MVVQRGEVKGSYGRLLTPVPSDGATGQALLNNSDEEWMDD